MISEEKQSGQKEAGFFTTQKWATGLATMESRPRDGKSDALPLVFIHGSGFCKEVFTSQFESEALADHHKIAIDLPGHGMSEDAVNPKQDYNYRAMGEKVLDTLSAMGIEQAILIGWSLGGQIALEISDDSRVGGVCAFGVAPIAPGPMGMMRGFHFSRDLLLASKAEFTESEARRFEKSCLGTASSGQYINALMRVDPAFRPALSRTVLRGIGVDQKALVENPQKPLCLMQGAEDPFIRTDYLINFDTMGIFAKAIILLDEAGHAPFLDTQMEFEDVLLGFSQWVTVNAFAFDRALCRTAV